MAKNSTLENFTVVVANEQTKGRGQQTNNWQSEPHKNLTISVFINDFDIEISNQKYLNFAISLAVFDMLKTLQIDTLSIKWPNDIMSANKKLCGILIENNIRNCKIHYSIVGIGLNINQEKFPDSLKNASSLKMLTGKEYNIDLLLSTFIEKLKQRIQVLSHKKYDLLETDYLNVLYKKNSPAMFKDSNAILFLGKIIGISANGNLQIELDDETIKEFGIKEVSFA